MSELFHSGRSKRDGAPIGSGRYPLGSGEEPYQHEDGINVIYNQLMKSGMTEKEVAKALNIVYEHGPNKGEGYVKKLRDMVSIAKEDELIAKRTYVYRMKQHGWSNTEIAKKMGVNESTVRSLYKAYENRREDTIGNIADTLKTNIDKDGRYIDVGPGIELEMGTTKNKLDAAVRKLEMEGYSKVVVQVPQMGLKPNQKTYVTVIAPPGTEYKDVMRNMTNIKTMDDTFVEGGAKTEKLHYPDQISSDRIMVRYAEDGGKEKDGVIELRRGVADLDLGEKMYGQVRINVDGTHYIKGMAIYTTEKLPKGVDIIVNSNKSKGTPLKGDTPEAKAVLKYMPDKNDPVNPFGSYIMKQRGALNLCKEEGMWDEQRDRLAAQFLAKQNISLAKKQLNLAIANKQDEFDTIMSMTNPIIKKKYLKDFADSCDAAAVELHAAALPRQAWKVILPISDLKDNEIYAPSFKNGEQVALVRYPHAGIFEIPVLKVNNNHPTANKVMHNAMDAVGINANVAAQLSGADFDGDTVLVIPTKTAKIRTTSPLAGLKDFDTGIYELPASAPHMSEHTKQLEMGKVSNLITDMQLKGVDPRSDEFARATRHSMVIIDAKKHHLDYKQSEKDNKIQELKNIYQNDEGKEKGGGASTLISRSKSIEYVPQRRQNYHIDPKTGQKIWNYTGESYKAVKKVKDPVTGEKKWVFETDPETGERKPVYTGKVIVRTNKSTRMAEADTPEKVRALSSGRPMENLYADYAISMKSLANKARLAFIDKSDKYEYNPSARKTYAEEVRSLEQKLAIAKKNAPRERQAQIIANYLYENKLKAHPDWKSSNDKKKKIRGQSLTEARERVNAKKKKINITDREWEAIQAGAITGTMLSQILQNSDQDKLKERALPAPSRTPRDSQVARMKAMEASGHTLKEIAEATGFSVSTISKYIK